MVTALITGASSGIGEAFARRLAAKGCDLFLIARSEDKLASICSELSAAHGITASYLSADLTADGADLAILEKAKSLGLEIDLLINNAGCGSMGDFSKLELERESEMIHLNVLALVHLTHRFLPEMRARRSGSIINVSSTAGELPIPFMATYAATKAFVTSFSIAVGAENRAFGVHVMAFCPGSTDTNFFEAGKIDRAYSVKGQHSAAEVVDAAIAALERKKPKFIPGWLNRIGALVSTAMPGTLFARIIANRLRKIYQKQD